jgi:uncharacterized membrane protein
MDDDRAGAPRVRALAVGSRLSHRLVRLDEWQRERFWAIPLVLIVAGIVTGVVVSRPETVWLPTDWKFGPDVRPEPAETIMQVMATSMLTFVGVVFAITLVGLQLASSQLSPRVIRTFVRSAVTKVAFGIFLATFAFSITGLAFDNLDDPYAAARTTLLVVAMLGVAVAVFVVYVTATMRLLEVGWVITRVANEARRAIRHGYPEATMYVDARPPMLEESPYRVRLRSRDTLGYRRQFGIVTGIDRPRLVDVAAKYDCVIELLPRIGEYVTTGGPVFAVHGATRPADKDLIACVDLGRSRTIYQDPAFGIRQLVDVAVQSLSAALNQPTTAVQVIDRLHDLLLRISRRPASTGMHVDDGGVVRLVERTTSFGYLLDLSFDEISVCGSTSSHVTRRLAAVYADLKTELPSDHHPDIERLEVALAELVGASNSDKLNVAMTPDRLGLG